MSIGKEVNGDGGVGVRLLLDLVTRDVGLVAAVHNHCLVLLTACLLEDRRLRLFERFLFCIVAVVLLSMSRGSVTGVVFQESHNRS